MAFNYYDCLIRHVTLYMNILCDIVSKVNDITRKYTCFLYNPHFLKSIGRITACAALV